MVGLQGEAMFDCVENTFSFARCLRQGSVEAAKIKAKDGHAAFGKNVKEWVRKRKGFFSDLE